MGRWVRPGAKVLVTNLYNRVQPLIRYEVGDVVTMSATPCPCGSPLPLVQSVGGRTKERFWLDAGGDRREIPYYLFLAGLRVTLIRVGDDQERLRLDRHVVPRHPHRGPRHGEGQQRAGQGEEETEEGGEGGPGEGDRPVEEVIFPAGVE